MNNPGTQATLGTRHRTKTNQTKNTWQKTKMINITGPTQKKPNKQNKTKNKKRGRLWFQVLAKDKRFLLLIRHPSCFSYSQVLSVIEVIKIYLKGKKIHSVVLLKYLIQGSWLLEKWNHHVYCRVCF